MVADTSFAEVWERTIRPQEGGLTRDTAQYFLTLQFTDADKARMNELAAKARDGSLAPDEETELGNYMQLGWFLDFLKSKARLSLGMRSAA